MKNIKTYTTFEIVNEASVNVDLTTEREKQAKLNDQITQFKKDMAKIDASDKKPTEKDLAKSKLVLQIGTLTIQIGESMKKESQLMMTISKTE